MHLDGDCSHCAVIGSFDPILVRDGHGHSCFCTVGPGKRKDFSLRLLVLGRFDGGDKLSVLVTRLLRAGRDVNSRAQGGDISLDNAEHGLKIKTLLFSHEISDHHHGVLIHGDGPCRHGSGVLGQGLSPL